MNTLKGDRHVTKKLEIRSFSMKAKLLYTNAKSSPVYYHYSLHMHSRNDSDNISLFKLLPACHSPSYRNSGTLKGKSDQY